jgi:hypothetical protein
MLQIVYNVIVIPVILRMIAPGQEMELTIFDILITVLAILVVGGISYATFGEHMGMLYYLIPFVFSIIWFSWYLKLNNKRSFLAAVLFMMANIGYSIAIDNIM